MHSTVVFGEHARGSWCISPHVEALHWPLQRRCSAPTNAGRVGECQGLSLRAHRIQSTVTVDDEAFGGPQAEQTSATAAYETAMANTICARVPASRRPTAAGTRFPVLCVAEQLRAWRSDRSNLVPPWALNSAPQPGMPHPWSAATLQLACTAKGWLADSCGRAVGAVRYTSSTPGLCSRPSQLLFSTEAADALETKHSLHSSRPGSRPASLSSVYLYKPCPPSVSLLLI